MSAGSPTMPNKCWHVPLDGGLPRSRAAQARELRRFSSKPSMIEDYPWNMCVYSRVSLLLLGIHLECRSHRSLHRRLLAPSSCSLMDGMTRSTEHASKSCCFAGLGGRLPAMQQSMEAAAVRDHFDKVLSRPFGSSEAPSSTVRVCMVRSRCPRAILAVPPRV